MTTTGPFYSELFYDSFEIEFELLTAPLSSTLLLGSKPSLILCR